MLSKNRQTSGVDWKLRSTEFGGWPMSENLLPRLNDGGGKQGLRPY